MRSTKSIKRTDYTVQWCIDVFADSPLAAARQALKIQRDRNSMANYFWITDDETGEHWNIDLMDLGECTDPIDVRRRF